VAVTPQKGLFSAFLALDRRVWILAATRCINTMGFSLVMPFMGIYLVKERGALAAVYGLLMMLSGLLAAGSQAIAGELADRYGRRTIMVTALAVRSANMCGLGLAVVYHAPIWMLGILLMLNGALRGQFEPAANAAVTDLAPAHLRVAAFGLQRIGLNLGWAIGPALGGALAPHSYGAMFFVAAPFMLGAMVAVLRGVEDRPPSRRGPSTNLSLAEVKKTFARYKAFYLYLCLVLLGSVMTVQLFSTLSIFSKTELHMGEAQIGLLYTVNGLLVVILQIPAVALIDRHGPRRALVFGPLLYTLAYLSVGLAEGFGSLALAVALLTAGEVVFAPALSDMAAFLGDPQRLGRAFGLFGLMQQLGVAVGPLVGGAVFDHYRDQHFTMWAILAGGMALVGVGYFLFAMTWRER
jgi:MFS family permease